MLLPEFARKTIGPEGVCAAGFVLGLIGKAKPFIEGLSEAGREKSVQA